MTKGEILLMFATMFKTDYLKQNELDDKYFYDNDVTNCLLKMYLLMLSNDEYEKRLEDFLLSYHKLNKEQQEYIQQDYLNIIKTRENKEKVLRKE